jgi:hypothetical protein
MLNANFELLNYNPNNPSASSNGFKQVGNALVPLEGKEQFLPQQVTVFAPLVEHVVGNALVFEFNDYLLFNKGLPIQSLQVDFGDGKRHKVIARGKFVKRKFSLAITKSHYLEQTYWIQYKGGATQMTTSTMYAKSTVQTYRSDSLTVTKDFSHTSHYAFQGYEEERPYFGKIDCRVFYAASDKVLRKPVFILDGFDPGDNRLIENSDYPIPDEDKKSIYSMMNYKVGEDPENLVATLNDLGYDVIICNFPKNVYAQVEVCFINGSVCNTIDFYLDGGADYVERNGLAFASLLQEINKELVANNSEESLVVLGPSMGGIISRYALAYMEKKQAETNDDIWDHNTRLWVSMDAPHLGATIPMGIQSLIYLLKDKASTANDLYENSLKSVTAQQFLINQHKKGSSSSYLDNNYRDARVKEQGYADDAGSPFFKQFYKNLYTNGLEGSNGFPMHTRNLAIVNGTGDNTPINLPEETTLYMRGYAKFCVLWFICTTIQFTALGTWNLPDVPTLRKIAKFSKWPNDKYVYAGAIGDRGNFDILPGGYNNTFDDFAGETKDSADSSWGFFDYIGVGFITDIFRLFSSKLDHYKVASNAQIHSFIPFASALAISDPDVNWEQGFQEDLFCDEGSFTPFDNYYVPAQNEAHIFLNNTNVAWLLRELEADTPPVRGLLELTNFDLNTQEPKHCEAPVIQIGGYEEIVELQKDVSVSLKASKRIVFSENFHVQEGASLHAKIEPCTSGILLQNADDLSDTSDEISENDLFEKTANKQQEFHAVKRLFPNPTSGILNIDTSSNFRSLKLYDKLGHLTFQLGPVVPEQIDLSQYQKGMYFLVLQDANGSFERHLIFLQSD